MAIAEPGILFRVNFSEISDDRYMITPVTSNATTKPFLMKMSERYSMD